MDQILSILKKCKYKGRFVSMLKSAGLWEQIEKSCVNYNQVSDVEKVYLYLHPHISLLCISNNKKRYLGFTRGYSKYCQNKLCQSCKAQRALAVKDGVIAKYGVDNVGKLDKAKEQHRQYLENKEAIAEAVIKRKNTNLKKYGVENPFQNEEIKKKLKQTNLLKYGVENPSSCSKIKDKKSATCFINYGVKHPLQSPIIAEKIKQTNLQKYGTTSPMQNELVKYKMMKTKVTNGSFVKSNSSREAMLYFRQYIIEKEYSIEQIAYDDYENNLHEWGYYFDRWYLYDFVAFEPGYRGSPNHVIEIIEYHGPFHYTIEDVITRGNDNAVPWKSNTLTIEESFLIDQKKEQYARQYLTNNYTVIWSEKWHKS